MWARLGRRLARLDDDFKELGLWAASIGLGCVVGLVHSYRPTQLNSIYAGVLFGMLFRVLLYAWRVNRATKNQAAALSTIQAGLAFSDLQIATAALPSLLEETARVTLNKYRQGVALASPGIRITAENWMVVSNRAFWTLLIEEQKKRPTEPIEVKITHSTAIELWDRHREMQDLLSLQEAFIAANGKIRRIFIAHQATPGAAHLRVMEEMKRRGIDVRYVCLDDVHAQNISYDFTFVERLNLAMKWYSGEVGKMVSECELTQLSPAIEQQWAEFDARSKPLHDFDPTSKYSFAGLQFGYYFSTNRAATVDKIIRTRWRIRGLPSLKATVVSGNNTFEGPIRVMGGQVYVQLRRNGKECWSLVFRDSLNELSEVTGVYVGASANSEPVAGLILLSGVERSDEEVRSRLPRSGPIYVSL